MQLTGAIPVTVFVEKIILEQVDLTGVEFFLTPFKGLDLSRCSFGGTTVPPGHHELRGAIISSAQALELVPFLGESWCKAVKSGAALKRQAPRRLPF